MYQLQTIPLIDRKKIMAKKTSLEKKNCKECNEEFMQTRIWQEFCSARCRLIHWKRDQKRDAPTLRDLESRIQALEQKIGGKV